MLGSRENVYIPNDGQHNPPSYHKWIKLAVAIWTVRMGIMGAGFMIPLLVSFVSLIPKSSLNFVPDTIIEIRSWELPSNALVKELCSENVPVVLTGAPLPPEHSVKLLLQAWLPLTLDNVKLNNRTNQFHYSDAKAPLCTLNGNSSGCFNDMIEHDFYRTSMRTEQLFMLVGESEVVKQMEHAPDGIVEVQTNCEGDNIEMSGIPEQIKPFNTELHITELAPDLKAKHPLAYVSYALNGSVDTNAQENLLLKSVAPFMSLYGGASLGNKKAKDGGIQSMLWIASKGAYVGDHYDMEHNYLLQLVGKKRVVITTPSGYDLFRPASALSPYWRQATRVVDKSGSLVQRSGQYIRDAVRNCMNHTHVQDPTARVYDNMDRFSVNHDQMCFTPGSIAFSEARGGDDETSIPKKKDEAINAAKELLFHPSTIISWEVLLNPGDVLYLPPLYFHSVVYESETSISINSWTPSLAYQTQQKLKNIVALPYLNFGKGDYVLSSDDDALNLELMKLAAVGSFARYTVRDLWPREMNMVMFRRRLASRFWEINEEMSEITKYFSCNSAQRLRAGRIHFFL